MTLRRGVTESFSHALTVVVVISANGFCYIKARGKTITTTEIRSYKAVGYIPLLSVRKPDV